MPGPKNWLQKALSDLKLATKAIGDDDTLDPGVYLTHQCAEKALKAFFMFMGSDVPRTHNLLLLLDDAAYLDKSFVMIKKECSLLNPYAINARYPNDNFFINQNDLAGALQAATHILNFVTDKIS